MTFFSHSTKRLIELLKRLMGLHSEKSILHGKMLRR